MTERLAPESLRMNTLQPVPLSSREAITANAAEMVASLPPLMTCSPSRQLATEEPAEPVATLTLDPVRLVIVPSALAPTALSASLPPWTARGAILLEVTAPASICGFGYLPLRSPPAGPLGAASGTSCATLLGTASGA